jgi:hypothetical protein
MMLSFEADKHQNVLLDELYKTICSAKKVKMF